VRAAIDIGSRDDGMWVNASRVKHALLPKGGDPSGQHVGSTIESDADEITRETFRPG